MTTDNSAQNSPPRIVKNVVITNDTIHIYKDKDSMNLTTTIFKNCILNGVALYELYATVFENCLIVDCCVHHIMTCKFKKTIIHQCQIEEIYDSAFQFSSLIECNLRKTDFFWTDFVGCKFFELCLQSSMFSKCTFKLCLADWESYKDTFVMISGFIKIWQDNNWITIEEDINGKTTDWLEFLRLHGVKIDQDRTE